MVPLLILEKGVGLSEAEGGTWARIYSSEYRDGRGNGGVKHEHDRSWSQPRQRVNSNQVPGPCEPDSAASNHHPD